MSEKNRWIISHYIEVPPQETLVLPKRQSHEFPKFTANDFAAIVGRNPASEELENLNCELQGFPGHLSCGLCPYHERPRSVCGCLSPISKEGRLPNVRIRRYKWTVFIEIERIDGMPQLPGVDSLFAELLTPIPGSALREVFSYLVVDDLVLDSLAYKISNLLGQYLNQGYIARDPVYNRLTYYPPRDQPVPLAATQGGGDE